MSAIRVRLEDVCAQDRVSVRAGERPELRYLGMESIESQSGALLSGDLSKTPDSPEANSFLFSELHVLYGKLRPYLNKVHIPAFEGKCSTELVPLRPTQHLNRQFLAYFLRLPSTVEKISQRVAGARMPRADMSFIMSMEMPLPPLEEQARIVDLLSRAENIVRMRKEAEAKAEEITPALFLEMFGDPATNPKEWEIRRLGDLATHMTDGPFGSNLKGSHYVESGVRVIRLQNIGVGDFIDLDRAYVSQAHFDSLPRNACIPGDVLVGTLGDPNLRAMILPQSVPHAINKADCVLFRCNPTLVAAEYICWLLNMPATLTMAAQMVQGITRTRIAMGRLRELFVPLPLLDHQVEFSRRAVELRSIATSQREATVRSERAFQSLSAELFGESA